MRCLIGDTLFVSVVILFGLVFVLYRFLFRDTDSLSTTVLVVIVYCRSGQYHRILIRRLNFPVVCKGCLICLFRFACTCTCEACYDLLDVRILGLDGLIRLSLLCLLIDSIICC